MAKCAVVMVSGKDSLDEAYKRCCELAYSHYENFPVARMVPKRLRKHVAAVYAFARTADDIADEGHDELDGANPVRVERLRLFEAQLDLPEKERDLQWSWIFCALSNTMKEFSIPDTLFRDLISAFSQDVVKKRYETFDELLDYCRRSANPVGRLVLILHGFRDESMFAMSDDICTALQLANFWQDMSVDALKNRIYVPKSDWGGADEGAFFAKSASGALKNVVKFECDRTRAMFLRGAPLVKALPFPLSLEIKVTLAGGMSILDKISANGFDTLSSRPSLGGFDKVKIFFKALFL